MSKSIYESTIWDGKQIKLAILVPTRDNVHSHFAFCLAELIKTLQETGINSNLFFDSSTILLNQRENLIKKAQQINADYVLWLDSDMMFPSTIVNRLLAHNKDIVACNYMKRSKPLRTVAYTDINDWDSWLMIKEQNDLVEVQGVGMGCMLMKTDIFNKLSKPYFEFEYKNETEDWLGEDFSLQRKLRDLNYKIYIDTVLSMEIRHVGIYAY